MKDLIILIGLPGTGKSTFVEKMNRDFVVISNDLYTEEKAKEWGVGYNEAFHRLKREDVLNYTKNKFLDAVKEKRNIIIDNTNLTKKERKVFLENSNEDYYITAIVFHENDEELNIRLEKRYKETGKFIPLEVIEKMKLKYEKPTVDEGFDETRIPLGI